MTAIISYDDVQTGAELPARQASVSRITLLLFGGQTMRMDFSAVHWSERAARAAGLPDVVMHGPLTAGKVLEIINDWTGDPGAILGYQLRLLRPIPVPDDDAGAVFSLSGTVEAKLDGRQVEVSVVATGPDDKALARVRATVALA